MIGSGSCSVSKMFPSALDAGFLNIFKNKNNIFIKNLVKNTKIIIIIYNIPKS